MGRVLLRLAWRRAVTYEIIIIFSIHVTTYESRRQRRVFCVDFITFTKVGIIYICRDNLLNIQNVLERWSSGVLCAVTPLKQSV